MNSVLYIGPDHRNHRGGIGAVLDVYAKHITPFKFIPTYVTKSFFKTVRCLCDGSNKTDMGLHYRQADKDPAHTPCLQGKLYA